MSTHHENFESWFRKPLELLFPDRDSGFAILLIAFPLLERYLRQKTGLTPDQNLSDAFFDELLKLFPILGSRVTATQFWKIYRNGLLHVITLSRQTRGGTQLPVGWLSHDKPLISIETDGSIWINPVDFARRVVEVIESDFATFEGTASATRLPTVKPQTVAKAGVSNVQVTIFGTNTDP
jgi:hypothetical protein